MVPLSNWPVSAFITELALAQLPSQNPGGRNNKNYQNLLRNVIAADFDTAARMLHCVTTPFVIREKVSREFRNESLKKLHNEPGDPDDEIVEPA